jgi:hypothetical protein
VNLLLYRQRQKWKTKYANIKNPLVADGKPVQRLESGVCNARASKVRTSFRLKRMYTDLTAWSWAAPILVAMPLHLFAETLTNSSDIVPHSSPYSVNGSLRQPAVSAVNGKVAYEGGNMDSSEGHNFGGTLTIPIAHHFGAQADALYSHIAGEDFWGASGHIFWRDPETGFVGVAGGGIHQDAVDTFQAGVEGGYYLKRFTFGAFAGVGTIRYDLSAPFIDTSPTRFIGRASVDWYALDDLRLGASYTTAFDNNLFKGEAEYQTPISGLALTGEVATGDNDYDHWLLGLRYYFGPRKPLRDRQRQDDPLSLMPQILHGLGLYGAEANHNARAYMAAHPNSGWDVSSSFEVERWRNRQVDSGGDLPPPPPTPIDDGNGGPQPPL